MDFFFSHTDTHNAMVLVDTDLEILLLIANL